MYIYTCVCIYTYKHTCMYIYVCMKMYICIHIYVYVYSCSMYACTCQEDILKFRIFMYRHIYIEYMHTHVYTYEYMRTLHCRTVSDSKEKCTQSVSQTQTAIQTQT